MPPPDKFCSFCGAQHTTTAYPKVCAACGGTTYANPKPVLVAIAPVGAGVLCVRRGIPPHVGKLALVGGFQVVGETWREAAVREFAEETGQVYHAEDVRLMKPGSDWDPVFSTPNDNILIFVTLPHIHPRDLVQGYSDPESLGTEVVEEAIELAFPAHTEALRRYLASDKLRHASWHSVGVIPEPHLLGQPHRTLHPIAVQRLNLPYDAVVCFSPLAQGGLEVFIRSALLAP